MKKLGIGCGIVLLLLGIVVGAIVLAWPRISKSVTGFVQDVAKNQQEQERLNANFTPPTPDPGEQWFPAEVAGWKRFDAKPLHEVPELGVTRDGYGAVYTQGGQQITVEVIPVTPLEKEGLFERAAGFTPRPENRGGRTSMSWAGMRETSYGKGERLYVRQVRDWFVLMHTLNAPELKPFAEAWLHAIDQPSASKPTPEAPQ